jgi:outer membrane protein OmpA-like peptidoglycan-associated protein
MKIRITTNRWQQAGNTTAPIVIIVTALAFSAGVFYFYTRKHLAPKETKPAEVQPADPTPVVSAPPLTQPPATPGASSTAPMAGAPGAGATAPVPMAPIAKPIDVGAQMAKALAAGDLATAAQMAAGNDPAMVAAALAVLEQITKGLGYKVGPADQVKVLGQVGDMTRVGVPLIRPGETAASLEILLEVMLDPQKGWMISKIRLPKELENAIAAANAKASTGTPMAGTPGASTTPGMKGVFTTEAAPDPLGIAHEFVQALLAQDYGKASKLVDPKKVPSQKVAGMCIVFEEGQYVLKASKPLVMTVAGADDAWVIAQVTSQKLNQATEFGLEMQRNPSNGSWAIVGLNLSDLLGSFAKGAEMMGVPYTPIVTNPRGGESLALYFEYDKASLHPRAAKQLDIVARMLKADPKRKLRITGHTDALGTDNYNNSLSSARAAMVKAQLAAMGVPSDQVVTEGLGKTAPISPNQKADGSDDPEGRSRNRRAEIYLDF